MLFTTIDALTAGSREKPASVNRLRLSMPKSVALVVGRSIAQEAEKLAPDPFAS